MRVILTPLKYRFLIVIIITLAYGSINVRCLVANNLTIITNSMVNIPPALAVVDSFKPLWRKALDVLVFQNISEDKTKRYTLTVCR